MKEPDGVRRHAIRLCVHDQPGVLVRVAMVFARQDTRIDSLVVSEGPEAGRSRLTVTARGEPRGIERVLRQLNRLVDVVYAHGEEAAG